MQFVFEFRLLDTIGREFDAVVNVAQGQFAIEKRQVDGRVEGDNTSMINTGWSWNTDVGALDSQTTWTSG